MKEVYEQLLSALKRLRGDLSEKEFEEIFSEYIYDKLSDQEILEIIKTDNLNSINLPKGLNKQAVMKVTLITLDMLKKSTTWAQFQALNKQTDKEFVCFDPLIEHLLKAKPPDETPR